MLPILQVVAALVPLLAQGDPEPQSGWLCWYGSDDAALLTAHAAFVLEADESLHPLAPATAPLRFETVLEVEESGTYSFRADVSGGRVTIDAWSLEGVQLSGSPEPDEHAADIDALELGAGQVRLEVSFQRNAGQPARLRVQWARAGEFALEPIPNWATSLPESARAAARSSAQTLRGRVLLGESGCANCHTPPAGFEHAVETRTAPDLAGVGGRADLDWLASWIADPRAHGAQGMPGVLAGEATEREARALAHFIASLEPGDPLPGDPLPVDLTESGWSGATEAEVLQRGRLLYHEVGCIACHGALESAAAVFSDAYLSADAPARGEIPLAGRADKWRASALSAFLLDPDATRPGARMPALGLSEAEADDLANYLVHQLGAGAPRPVDPGLVEAGRGLFAQRGCAACHALDGATQPMPGAPAFEALAPGRGCLDPEGAGPRYALTPGDRGALGSALDALSRAEFTRAPIDEAVRRVSTLRCAACHELDGAGGPAESLDAFFRATDERVDLGDEGRLPPDLTGVGSKLQPQWLKQVLSEGARARPYLGVRMPHFAEVGAEVAEGLTRAEGPWPERDRWPAEPTDEAIRVGRELVGPESFNCMTCHVHGDFPPTGSPGPAITQFAERLRYKWFRNYMQNPQRYKPGGRMPDFRIDGRSSLTAVLDGDLDRQVEALWSYFELGEFMPAPDGVEASDGFPLPVGNRPVVHRGFLLDVGARGIAVGLPVGVHFAFDARTCRLVHAWRGAFIDASGSWAGRGGTQLGGQGPIVWTAPEGPAFRLVDGSANPLEVEPEYRGYHLDADGWPTFTWSLGEVSLAESFSATLAPELVITRRFEFEGLPGNFVELAVDDALAALRLEGGVRAYPMDKHAIFSVETQTGRPAIEMEVRP